MPRKMNAEAVLAKLAEMRSKMPFDDEIRNRKRPEKTSRMEARDLEEFEMLSVADALEDLANDTRAMIDKRMAEAMEKALDVYYTAEELARLPEHAELIPHVENMRAAYQKQYGRPMPTKAETEERRRKKDEEKKGGS